MEDVCYLEADPVDQDQISADEYVAIAGIGRRKHDLQLLWARLHSAAKAQRQRAVHDQLALEAWRQAITLGEPGRKMTVVGAVPAVDVAVTIFVMAVTMAVFTEFVTVALIAIVVIAVVFVMTVALCHSHAGGKRE
jgi:hypothetical protein